MFPTFISQLSEEALLRIVVLDARRNVAKSLVNDFDKPANNDQKKALLPDEDVPVDSINGNGVVSKAELPVVILREVASERKLELDTILLIICSNRPDYLKRTLENVLRYHPRSVPLI